MSNEVLTQDEVDTLLKGVPAEQAEPEIGGGVRPYDRAAQEAIVRGRLRTLDLIHVSFVKLFRSGLFDLLRHTAQVTGTQVRVSQFAEFVSEIALHAHLNIARVEPLQGCALIVFEPALVSLVVEKLFGGKGSARSGSDGRDFSRTEQRIIQRTLAIVLDSYQRAWAEHYPIKLEYVRSEAHPHLTGIAAPNDIVAVATFNVDFETGIGAFHICIPCATFERIRDRLEQPLIYSPFEPDPQWEQALGEQVKLAEVELTADLVNMQLTVRELLNIQVGDVLSIDIAPLIPASIDGVRMFECSYGAYNGQYAVRIDRVLPIREQYVLGS